MRLVVDWETLLIVLVYHVGVQFFIKGVNRTRRSLRSSADSMPRILLALEIFVTCEYQNDTVSVEIRSYFWCMLSFLLSLT
jgi:hypothetical protein